MPGILWFRVSRNFSQTFPATYSFPSVRISAVNDLLRSFCTMVLLLIKNGDLHARQAMGWTIRTAMDVKLSTVGKGPVSFTSDTETLSDNLLLPGARVVLARAEPGTILHSSFSTPWFIIWHQQFNISHPVVFEIHTTEPVLLVHIVLRGPIRYNTGNTDWLKWQDGQLNMFCAGPGKFQVAFDDVKEYTTLTIQFSRSYLDVYTPYFTGLQQFLQKSDNTETAFLSNAHTSLTPEMINIIRDILNNQYTGEVKNIYLRNKVSELLLLAFTRITPGAAGNPEIRLHQYDIDKIREAREYLLQNMDQPLTVIELSHKVGINDYKLKKGFKQLYGVTIFDFLLEARMEKARTLLTETDTPIHEIAFLTGYKNVSSFTAAFKKRMGFPPSSMKKKDK